MIETVGLVVSTLKFLVSEPLFPARSMLVTVTVCGPSASGDVVNGELQTPPAPPSTAQLVVPALRSETLKVMAGVAVPT